MARRRKSSSEAANALYDVADVLGGVAAVIGGIGLIGVALGFGGSSNDSESFSHEDWIDDLHIEVEPISIDDLL